MQTFEFDRPDLDRMLDALETKLIQLRRKVAQFPAYDAKPIDNEVKQLVRLHAELLKLRTW